MRRNANVRQQERQVRRNASGCTGESTWKISGGAHSFGLTGVGSAGTWFGERPPWWHGVLPAKSPVWLAFGCPTLSLFSETDSSSRAPPSSSPFRNRSAVKCQSPQRVHLLFEAAGSAMYVWVNGHMVGYSQDSYVQAEFDITEHLVQGRNLVACQVRSTRRGHMACENTSPRDAPRSTLMARQVRWRGVESPKTVRVGRAVPWKACCTDWKVALAVLVVPIVWPITAPC